MKIPFGSTLKSSQGIALIMVIMVMVILLSITGASLLFTGLTLKSAGSVKSGTRALHVADAGIQHAIAVVNPGSSLSYTAQTTVVNSTSFGYGYSYAVTALNGPGSDQATLTSTAVGSDGAKAMVQAVVVRRVSALPPIPGAMSIVGEAEGSFRADEMVIDGNDFDMNGHATSNPAKRGITVGDISAPSPQTPQQALDNINNALSHDQKDHHVLGLGRNQATNTPSTGIDNSLTKQTVKDFVNLLKIVSDSYLTVSSLGGNVTGNVTTSTSGSSGNITIGSRSINMGSAGNPKIVFFEGVPAGAPGDLRLKFTGTIKGHGILVMKDNDLQFLGELDWKGLIIVSGPHTSIAFQGGDDQKILGGVVVNETDTDTGASELSISNDDFKLRASKEALDMVQSMLNNKPTLKVVAWKQP